MRQCMFSFAAATAAVFFATAAQAAMVEATIKSVDPAKHEIVLSDNRVVTAAAVNIVGYEEGDVVLLDLVIQYRKLTARSIRHAD